MTQKSVSHGVVIPSVIQAEVSVRTASAFAAPDLLDRIVQRISMSAGYIRMRVISAALM